MAQGGARRKCGVGLVRQVRTVTPCRPNPVSHPGAATFAIQAATDRPRARRVVVVVIVVALFVMRGVLVAGGKDVTSAMKAEGLAAYDKCIDDKGGRHYVNDT